MPVESGKLVEWNHGAREKEKEMNKKMKMKMKKKKGIRERAAGLNSQAIYEGYTSDRFTVLYLLYNRKSDEVPTSPFQNPH